MMFYLRLDLDALQPSDNGESAVAAAAAAALAAARSEAEAATAVAVGPAKRRRALLRGATAAAAAAATARAETPLTKARMRAVGMLRDVLTATLWPPRVTSSSSLAAALVVFDTSVARQLDGRPRAVLHRALTRPEMYVFSFSLR